MKGGDGARGRVRRARLQRRRCLPGYRAWMPDLPLDDARLRAATAVLAERDPDLGGIVARLGPPPLWDRLRSGAAAFERLRLAAGAVEAEPILALGEAGARAAGLTRQKARYVVGLAEAATDGRLEPAAIASADDDDARARLTALLGIGRWTADIYLLMALGRPDIWPDGDLALASAMRRAKGFANLPDRSEQRLVADSWRPWRAVGARVLWQAYLAGER